MISHLNGGNCSREEAERYRREFAGVTGWDGTLPDEPVRLRLDRRLRGAPPQSICPRCLGPMRELPGYDDYCPPCRQREELAVEREVVAAEVVRLTKWFEGGSDAPHSI